jgi:cbb3-type cytochrome oxidase subunit 3
MEINNSLDFIIFNAYWKSIDFVYVAIQNLWMYDFTARVNDVCDLLRENQYFFFYEILLLVMQTCIGFELFVSNVYDSHIKDILFLIDINENTLRKYTASLDYTLFSIYHPEFGYYSRIDNASFFTHFSSSFYFFIYDNIKSFSLDIPVCVALQLGFLVFFILFFICFFFSFFNNSNKEEWAADTDYAVSNLAVEAEKEIFSADDAVYLFLSLLFFFGAYFGFLFLGVATYVNDASFFFWALPVFAGCLIFMPVNLLLDFGLLFALYLRGSSNTSSFLAELGYDYIGIVAFFTRLVVQFVRLILMFVVYCMMHDTVLLQEVSHWFLPVGDNFFDEIFNIRFNVDSVSYFLSVTLPCRLFYWLYEVLHTFFVVTAQFAAFFTIAIWLFLLFYTFFVFEKYENHFSNLRVVRAKMFSDYKSLSSHAKK